MRSLTLVTEQVQKGRKWLEQYMLNRELYHYGVKGMKWGVRNKPLYLKRNRKNSLISEEIRSGRVSKIVNREKQNYHTIDKHLTGRSYLNGDIKYAQKLIDDLGGTGVPVMSRKGEWIHKERVESRKNIGIHVDVNGVQTETNKAMIVYSKTGAHIYPRKED